MSWDRKYFYSEEDGLFVMPFNMAGYVRLDKTENVLMIYDPSGKCVIHIYESDHAEGQYDAYQDWIARVSA